MIVTVRRFLGRSAVPLTLVLLVIALASAARPVVAAAAQPPVQTTERAPEVGGEASLVLPDLSIVDFRGVNARTLLLGGLGICALGLLFGLMNFTQLRNLPVHPAMRDVSELIYETCKTYLITQ